MNPDEIVLASLDLVTDTAEAELASFRTALATAYKLGHATRVEKVDGYYGAGSIFLYAVKQVTPEWTCECGIINNGLASDCRTCEGPRP